MSYSRSNDRPDEQRYPFVIAPVNESTLTPSQLLRCQAGLATYSDDFPDSEVFANNLTAYSDDEGEKVRPPHDSLLLPYLLKRHLD